MANKAKVGLVALAGIAVVWLAAWKLAPDGRTDEQRILDALVEIQDAVASKSVRNCMKHVSEGYSDTGNENRRALTRLCIQAFRERGKFSCTISPQRPIVDGKRATVEMQVDFAIDYGDKVNREGPFAVRTRWAKEDKEWLLVRAEGYMTAENAYDSLGW